VKNYNIEKNQSGLISNVSKQTIQRAENLPQGMQQQVVIDVRGQMITVDQERKRNRGQTTVLFFRVQQGEILTVV
jgi:filamentous hemagglutinin